MMTRDTEPRRHREKKHETKMVKHEETKSGSKAEATTLDGKNSPELCRILEILRPFQREAYEFAIRGSCMNVDNGSGLKERKASNPYLSKAPESVKSEGPAGRILLADEMGLGKTVSSLAIMLHYRTEWPLLILCPASLRYTWPSEIEKFIPSLSPRAVYVVSGMDDADFYSNPHKRERIQIVVATYSLLQTRSAVSRVLQQFKFKCVIADESHNLKERTSQRCQIAMPLLKQSRRLLLLSGTPALARPVELWPQLNCIDESLFGAYTTYTKTYCNARRGRFGWDVTGTSNADELHTKLRGIMVRRLKSDVLKELPPKQRSIVPIKIDPKSISSCREVVQDLNETRIAVSDLVGEESRNAHFEARRLLMTAYQTVGVGKAKAVAEFLLDWLDGSHSQKILVFAHHLEVLDILESAVSKKFKGVGHIRIDGSVSPAERALRVRKFQTNARVRVGILSVTAAGVGLTLTAASSIIFAELHWTPGVLAQAEDRCHRIGQHNAVNVMYCVCKDTELSVDMSLWAMLGRKMGNLGRIIDGNKGVSMNATEADEGTLVSKNDSGGMSAQDELASFFADTSPKSNSTTASNEIVKGSIQSFFQKPKAPPKDEQSTTVGHSRDSPGNRNTTSHAQIVTPSTPLVENQLNTPPKVLKGIQWTCRLCTFINEKNSTKCEMCDSPMNEVDHSSTIERSANLNSASRMTYCDSTTPDHSHSISISQSPSPDHAIESSNPSRPIECIDLSKTSSLGNPKQDYRRKDQTKPRGIQIKGNEIIEIDDDSLSGPLFETESESPTELLSFSVSKNSGRITVHIAETEELLQINFEIEQILTKATSDTLLDTLVKRSSRSSHNASYHGQQQALNFDESAVIQLVERCRVEFLRHSALIFDLGQCCDEIKAFVSCFCSLREVEKKALKEWGKPILPSIVPQTVARIMCSTLHNQSIDRYKGGSKERAMEKLSQGECMDDSDRAVLDGTACAWCAQALSSTSLARGVESTYCSQSCAEEGRLRRGGIYASTRVRAQVFALESGVCQQCGIDAHALFLRISSLQPAERLNALCNANWRLPRSRPALERLLQLPKEGDFWQADHILAVAEGGGDCGLENLQTLCAPCHKLETEKLRSRIRLNGGPTISANSSNSQDIRSVFLKAKSSTTGVTNTKRRRRNPD